MLFNSWKYLLFLPAVVVAFYLIGARYRWALLLAASLFFYLFANPYHITVIAAMTMISYAAAIQMEERPGRKGGMLLAGLLANGCALFVFKYFNFFLENVSVAASLFNVQLSVAAVRIIIPVGISYITFQLMSYLIEVHNGALKAERHAGIFSLYVLFFPKVNSGPIERPQDLIGQLREPGRLDPEQVAEGIKLVTWGFFKKMVIADRLAVVVNQVYNNLDSYSGLPLVVATVFFTFQLYCDFSGYTDIALGSARLFGIRLTPNFNRPFFATSLTDFWRRWHITLSSWLRDYLYTPIAFNRRYWGRAGIVFALVVTFTLCGLWHGASWNFVLFGLLNGLGLSVEFLLQKKRTRIEKRFPVGLVSVINALITVAFFTFTLIFFRAVTVADSWYVITHLFSNFGASVIQFGKTNMGLSSFEFRLSLVLIAVLMMIEFAERRGSLWSLIARKSSWRRWIIYYGMVLALALLGVYSSKAQFIYFQF